MTDKERAITPEEVECIKDTLKRLGYFSEGDKIETCGNAMTGVAGRSRVFVVIRRSANGMSQRFVAKFDKTRTAKELLALAKLHSTNFPTNFLANLDGLAGLREMPAENGLILYKAADSVTLNYEILSLHQYLLKHADTSLVGDADIFTKALDSLSLLYRQASQDTPNRLWSDYFPEVVNEDKLLYKSLIGKTVADAIEKCEGQIGNHALAPIHGDLNLANILVAMQDQTPRDVVFIDFADYQEKAPIVLDFVKLETELWLETAAVHADVRSELELKLAALIVNPASVECRHPALVAYAQLAQAIRERAKRHMGISNFNACYGEPLVYAFLRAMTYKSIRGDAVKTRLAQIGAQAAWELYEYAPNLDSKFQKSIAPLKPEPRISSECSVRKLVLGKLSEHFKRSCWEPILKSLYLDLDGRGEVENLDLTVAVSELLLQKEILDVPLLLAKVLSNSTVTQATHTAWEDGLNILGWLVIANVNPACQILEKDNVFHLSLETLLGAEVVLSWRGRRQALFKDEDQQIKCQLSMEICIEPGPGSIDCLALIAVQICRLVKFKVPKIWDEKSLRTVNAMIKARNKLNLPYYLVTFTREKDHPLNVKATRNLLKLRLPDLMLVYLEPVKNNTLNVLLMDEHELTGYLWIYMETKQRWVSTNSKREVHC